MTLPDRPRPAAAPAPIDASALFTLLDEDPEVRVLAQVRPGRSWGLGAIAEPHPACPPVAVVEMAHERARALTANPQVIVELDQPPYYPPVGPLAPSWSRSIPRSPCPSPNRSA